MMPLLGGAMAACTYHFFYNSPSLDSLVALQVLPEAHVHLQEQDLPRGGLRCECMQDTNCPFMLLPIASM